MRKAAFYIISFLLAGGVCFAQVHKSLDGHAKRKDSNELIANQIFMMERSLKSGNYLFLHKMINNETLRNNLLKDRPDLKDISIKIKNINLNNNAANALVSVKNLRSETAEIVDTIQFEFIDKSWKIKKIKLLDKVIDDSQTHIQNITHTNYDLVQKSSIMGNKNSLVQNLSTTPYVLKEINLNNDLANQLPFYYDILENPVYNVGYEKTNTYLSSQLFAAGSKLDCALYPYQNEDFSENFVIDSDWKRIIYGNYSDQKITSYGDHENEYHFNKPVAIAVNQIGDIFVLDQADRKIIKLHFNESDRKIYLIDDNLSRNHQLVNPTDLAYYSTGYVEDGDVIFVADEAANSIVQFTPLGEYLEELKTLDVFQRYNVPINSPRRLAVDSQGNIGYIDGNNTVVVGTGIYSDIFFTMNEPAKFPQGSNLLDIGLDLYENFVVSDNSLRMWHKFGTYGDYLGSFTCDNSKNPFIAPTNIYGSQFPDIFYPYGNIYIDAWGSQTGFRDFLARVKLLNLRVDKSDYKNIELKGIFSGTATYDVQLIRLSDGAIIDHWEYGYGRAMDNLLHRIPNTALSPGQYKYIVKYIPRKDWALADEYKQGEQISEIVFNYEPILLPSNITSSMTIQGLFYSNGLTVAKNATLTIGIGTSISFQDNSSLIVNGTLNATGTTFDFISRNSTTSNGIKVYGEATINSATIKNADKGLYVITPARLTLSNSTITNCSYGVFSDQAFAGVYSSNFTGCGTGVYCTNTNSTSTTPAIEHNTFYNSSFGIYLSVSSPRINGNTFSKGAYGIYCINNSSPSFGNADEAGDCSFSDNKYGMVILNGSNPVLGTVDCINSGGYNMFLRSSSYHIWADNTCVVEAKSNYWNELKITGAYVYYDPYYLVDAFGAPMGSMAQSPMSQSPEEKLYNVELRNASSTSVNLDVAKENINSQGTTEPQYNEKWFLKAKTSFLRNLVLLKKYDNAIKIGKELIKGYPDSTLSVYALDLLWQAGRTSADRYKDFDGFLKELTSKGEKKYLHGKAETILALCDSINRIDALDKVAEKFKGDKLLTEEILMDKFSSLLSRPEDREKASLVLGEIDARFPNSQASGIAHLLFDGEKDNLNGSLLGKESSEGKDNAEETNSFETVKEYELLGNYPNPFNPETVISYALPEESNVELRIYNLMGKLVRTFAYNSQTSGYKNITWNGKDESGVIVSSGIYIYRLQAVSNKNQGHVFIKSAGSSARPAARPAASPAPSHCWP